MINTVLQFWFKETRPEQWWKKDPDFDAVIRNRFSTLHGQAAQSELYGWRTSPEGRLAEIIILDQFSRNMYRDSSMAFFCDNLALCLAQTAVACGDDKHLEVHKRAFIYLPYMHSESLVIHREAEKLYSQPGLEANLEWEIKHKNIIERFGRYPHRNEALGRVSTREEEEFLLTPGSRF